ncbi:MAG TPA: molybdopterin cofactor-binding domain-containing protein, partial [Xanthobacteraceae bacterium]|nr:molybdopterin cofactor-binding domain-containing protein [Xanthobacteraceae bacterium]
MDKKFGIGQPVPRVEDPRFITGRGRYVDDFDLPRQCHGVLVMSPHAHARIKGIDATKAKAAPGVLAVLTGADVIADKLGGLAPPMPEDMGGPKGFRTVRSILATDKVRAVGERVAFVVAETPAQARDAAEMIEVDYEPLPAVIEVEDAVKPGAPAIWDEAPNNVSFALMMGSKDATDAAFAAAKHVVTLKVRNTRITANSIEPRAAIGEYHPDADNYTLYSTSQNPHGTRSAVAGQVLKIPETRLRVISPDVGGGFGMKHGGYPEDALVVWASRHVGGRPVKWVSTRSEALLGDSQGRDQVVTGELALDERGKILGMRVAALHNMGSHVFGAAVVVPLFALRLAPGVYEIPAVHAVGRAVLTNTIPLAPYRGAGRPEATYLIEQLLDKAARALGIDPVEIRRRNYIPATAMPYRIGTGITYDSGDFVHVMDEC